MKQQKLPALLALVFCVLFSSASLMAQNDREDQERHPEHPEKSKEPSPFFSRLWYGGGVNIGFSGYNGASVFGFGLSPMVGYKIYGPFSAGPRISLSYTSIKQSGSKALNLLDTEAGLFLRAKVFRGFFLQGEASHQWGNDVFQDYYTGELSSLKNEYDNQYLGAGYNFGDGQFGSEISVFYNLALANDITTYRSPFDYRITFTYKF